MAQWNLSVQLTGQGTDLVSTLRRSSTQARALTRDIAEARRELTRLRQSAGGDIRIGVRVDLAGLEAAAEGASRALDGVQHNARQAGRALSELRTEALGAAAGLRSINTAAGRSNGRLETLSGRTRTLRTDLDQLDGSVQRVGGRMGSLRGSIGGVGNSSQHASGTTRQLLVALAGLSTSLAPVAAAAAPLAVSLGAAGASVGAFGIALAGQVGALGDAADAQKKYDEAVRDHGPTSKEAAQAQQALQAQMAAMPAPTRQASAALASLKSQYQSWSDSLAGDTMPAAIHSFETLSALLPRLTPLVKGAAGQMDHLVAITAGGIASDSFDRLFNSFDTFATGALHKVTNEFVHLLQVLSGQAPAGSQALREFMTYARANAPEVAATLKQVAAAMLNLLVAAGDMGIGVLQVVQAFARLVSAIPSGVLSTLMQLYAAFKLVSLGAAALNAVTGSAAIARLGAYFAVMRAAGVGQTLRATVQSMSSMQKAALGLGVLGVAAIGIDKLAEKARGAPPDVDRLTTSLKNLATTGKLTGELKDTFGSFNGLIDALKNYQKEAKGAKEANEGNFGFHIPVLDDVASWFADRTNDIVKGGKSFTALKEDFQGVDKALAQMASSGNAKQAAAGFDLIRQAGQKAGYSTKEINKLLPDYQKTVASLKVEQQLAAAGMGVFGQQAQDTSAKLNAQKASADGLRQSIQALNDVNRQGLGGMIGFEAAIDAASQAAQKNAGALSMTGGQLNLNSQKARDAATSLNDLAAKTDEAAASARQSGASWETVNGIYARGRAQLIASAQTMGLTKSQAESLAASILHIPDSKKTKIEMEREDAIAGLNAVMAKIKATPGSKSVTVKALTASAIQQLEALGFKVTHMKDGTVRVSVPTGGPRASVSAIQGAINSLHGKTVTNTVRTNYVAINQPRATVNGVPLMKANGGTVDYYSNGGIQRGDVRHFSGGTEQHVAQMAPAGSWRVWAEPETGGEAYIPLAPSKRPRSRKIAEETIKRLGGDPKTIQWNADGNVTDWRYDPQTGSLYSPSDAGSAAHKTKKVKGKDVEYFSLSALESKLRSSSRAASSWSANLEKVADRVGTDVADALASMGEDGVALTKKMATGSTKYINEMAAALRGLAKTARASLTDYTRELSKATATDSAFQANLARLAAGGYGDLASQLAAQNDTAAQQLAAAAVKDRKKASSANTAARRANQALTSDQVAQLVQIIAAVKTSKTGIHDVAAATGLGEDDIVTVAAKASNQIKSSLGSRSTRFLADLARAQRGLSYANGGIRPGIYGTRGGAVTFAEPATGGEAYIPLGGNKRASATNVLTDVAGRFGLGLTDARAGRVVVISQEGPTTIHVPVTKTNASAYDIGHQVGRQMRRARRGGVAARAGR